MARTAQSVDEAKDFLAKGERSSALTEAASKGHLEIAKLLIDNGADVNAMGGTALRKAVWMCPRCTSAMVELLLGKGADVNKGALTVAVRRSRTDTASLRI